MSSSGSGRLFPASTFLNSGRVGPSSPNLCSIFACNNGVSLAWVNLLPASSRHAFSSKDLVVNSWQRPSVPGPMTTCNAPWRFELWRADHMLLAIFLACSVDLCCFHNAFIVTPLADACAFIMPTIQVSRWSGSFFKCWNDL